MASHDSSDEGARNSKNRAEPAEGMRIRSLGKFALLSLVVAVLGVSCWRGTGLVRISDNVSMADPSAIKVGSIPYVVTTEGSGMRFPIWKLTSSWRMPAEPIADAMPNDRRPSWVKNTTNYWGFWAPDISKWGDTYYLYFTAPRANTGSQLCIGVGWSSSVTGPYTFSSTPVRKKDGSFLCDVIDPNLTVSLGKRHLVFSNYPTQIQAARLNSAGTQFDTDIVTLLARDAADGGVVENPSMVWLDPSKDGTGWHLTYSHHDWMCDDYGTAIVECSDGPRAACTRDPYNENRRVVQNADGRTGTGGLDFVYGSSSEYVFHAWNGASATCDPQERFWQRRSGWKGEIEWAIHWNGYFADDDGTTHEADTDWLAERGIVSGCGSHKPPRYCPNDVVTRGNGAQFFFKAFDLPTTSTNYFDDDDGLSASVQQALNAVAHAGILNGCAYRRACPADALSRGALAVMLSRALNLPALSLSQQTHFTDIPAGVYYREAAHQLWVAGITTGCASRRFCGEDLVNRGQMASFLKRSLD